MRTTVYVISDAHLGGRAGKDGGPGFQMCPAPNQAQLSAFVDTLPGRSADADVRLVIAGDLVDFLAEERFEAFTLDQHEARAKFDRIVESTAPVWTALKEFVERREGALTLMLGNHDIELSLPQVRRRVFETLGEGRVEFLYDNEAYTCGPVLIEHGNRYDEWNAAAHGALRRVRSQLSRGLKAGVFPAPPGSQLVAEVMNRLKADYSFVDLLKPENAGTLPILAALGAGSPRNIWKGFQKYRQTYAVDYDEDREPTDETYIAAPDDADQAMFALAEDIAAGGNATQVNALTDALTGARDAVVESVREYRRRALFTALRRSADSHRRAFDVSSELATYEKPAKRATRAGYQVVVYGHTHLAKRVQFDAAGGPLPVYLNTGTWADLVRVPDAVWAPDEGNALDGLRDFVADLERDDVSRWRRAAPTYARIELDEKNRVNGADIYFADGADSERVTTEGLVRRLAGGE